MAKRKTKRRKTKRRKSSKSGAKCRVYTIKGRRRRICRNSRGRIISNRRAR